MIIPGFTAEASLYRQHTHYRAFGTFDAAQLQAAYPQFSRRATGPYGPIGFPGQDCGAACWHVCSLGSGPGGWGFDRCMQDCAASCYPALGLLG